MIKALKQENGFTLIEMMIVLLVISVLLIITIPNIMTHNSNINSKGCDAFVKMVQAQAQAFEMEFGKPPKDIQELVTAEYLNGEDTSCQNGKVIEISAEGKVSAVEKNEP